jgi:hypothetical protein
VFANDPRAIRDTPPVPLFVLSPFESFGPLQLGASRNEVRAALGEDSVEFFKGDATVSTQAYRQAGLHAHYDAAGTLELVEAFSPCRAMYAGVDLLDPDVARTLDQLRRIGLESRDDHQGGLRFDEHGFALYAPSGVTEGMSVFRRGYDTST